MILLTSFFKGSGARFWKAVVIADERAFFFISDYIQDRELKKVKHRINIRERHS